MKQVQRVSKRVLSKKGQTLVIFALRKSTCTVSSTGLSSFRVFFFFFFSKEKGYLWSQLLRKGTNRRGATTLNLKATVRPHEGSNRTDVERFLSASARETDKVPPPFHQQPRTAGFRGPAASRRDGEWRRECNTTQKTRHDACVTSKTSSTLYIYEEKLAGFSF